MSWLFTPCHSIEEGNGDTWKREEHQGEESYCEIIEHFKRVVFDLP